MSKENSYPASANQLEPDFVKQSVSDLLAVRNTERPKTDEECSQRIDTYFRYCQSNGMRPGIEGLCLCIGITRQTLYNWKVGKGCSEERSAMTRAAIQFIVANLENAFMSGRLNPVSGIFMLKNWANYADRQDISINASEGTDDLDDGENSIEALEKKYAGIDVSSD